MPGVLRSLAISLGPGKSEAVFIGSIIIKKSFSQEPEEVDTSNRWASVAHISSDPKGVSDFVQRCIMIFGSCYKFSDEDKAANSRLGIAAFPERIIVMALSELRLLSHVSVKTMKQKLNEFEDAGMQTFLWQQANIY